MFIPGNYTATRVLFVHDQEMKALQNSKEGQKISLPETVLYVKDRIEYLEQMLAQPYYSRSEKNVMAQMIMKLVIHVSITSDNFRKLTPEESLYFQDRQGASVFRANLQLFRKTVLDTWSDVVHELWMLDNVSRYAIAHELLEYYKKIDIFMSKEEARSLHEKKRYLKDFLNPREEEVIGRDVGDHEKLARETGVTPDKWKKVHDKVVIKIKIPSYEEAIIKAEEHRRKLIEMLELKGNISLQGEAFLSPTHVNADDLLEYLKRNQNRVCIYAGSFYMGMPLSVYYTDGQRLLCEHICPKKKEDIEAHIGFNIFIQGWCLQELHINAVNFVDIFENIIKKNGSVLAELIYKLMNQLQKKEILFIRNLVLENTVPWESLPLRNGRMLGDIFPMAHVHFLAKGAKTDGMPKVDRVGTLQVAGTGKSGAQMKLGAGPMKHLAKVLKNTDYSDGVNFHWWSQDGFEKMFYAEKMRFFLHGT